MRRHSWFRLCLPAVTAVLLQASPCLAFPPLPSSYYGRVRVNGSSVPAGTVVRAVIAGHTYAESYTQIYQGDSVFGLDVPGDDLGSTTVEGGREGDQVSFEVGGLPALATGLWHSGTNVSLDLAASGAVSLATVTPSPVPTRTSSPTPRPSPSPRPPRPSPTPTPHSTLTPPGGLASTPVGRTSAMSASITPLPQTPTEPTQIAVTSGDGSHSGQAVAAATEVVGDGPPTDTPGAGRSEAQAETITPTQMPGQDQPSRGAAGAPEPTPLLAPATLQAATAFAVGQEIDSLATWRSRCRAGLAAVAVAGCGMAVGLVWTRRRRK